MPVPFLITRLAVSILLTASLVLPSSAIAAKQEEELAPGFNACMKKAAASNTDSDSEIKCYNSAYEYWNDIFEKEYKKKMDYYEKNKENIDFIEEDQLYALKKLHGMWKEYTSAWATIMCHEAAWLHYGFVSFMAEETKRMVERLRNYGVFDKPAEESKETGQTKSFTN